MILESALISSLVPAGVDLLKTIFGGLGRRIGGLSVDDEIKLDAAQVSKLQALAQLDTPVGTPSQWVIDLRASFRYIAAGVSIFSGIGIIFLDPLMMELGASLITIPFSFIFGERMLLTMKASKK